MNQYTSLRHAAAAGDGDSVHRLLDKGADVGEADNASLRWALRHKRPSIVKLLLDAGANVADALPEFLGIAAKNGDVSSLRQLLKMKLPILPNALDLALYDAITAKKSEAVKILIEAGANPTAEDNKPVMLASSAGSAAILEILHQQGADLFVSESQTLFNSVMAPDAPSVKFLLRNGVDPNAKMGISLVMAIANGDTEIVELLLSSGAKLPTPSLVDHCATSDSIETLLLLAEYGYPYYPYADEIAKCAAGCSAYRILKFILEKAVVSQAGCNEALISAAEKSSEMVLNILIQHGADAGADQSAALKVAITASHFGHARKLLSANAHAHDLNAQALLCVANGGDWSLFTTLLQAGASVTGVTLAGAPALEMFQHVTAANMLRNSGGNFLPRQICDERKNLVHACAKIAVAVAPDKKIHVTQWLTEFLIQYHSI